MKRQNEYNSFQFRQVIAHGRSGQHQEGKNMKNDRSRANFKIKNLLNHNLYPIFHRNDFQKVIFNKI